MIRVLIADDHAVVRRGLRQILEETSDMSVAGEAVDGHAVLDLVRTLQCDVLVMDMAMPGPGGLEILNTLKHELPQLPILILSIHPEDQFALRTLKAGASGYLTKESAPDELVKAIRKVVAGGKYVSPSLAEQMALALDEHSDQRPHELLSDREYQVMLMIASGKASKEIAEALALSVKTISTYRARILQKMKLKTNAEIIHYALQNHLL